MYNKLKSYINLSIITSILFFILGLFLVIFPKTSLDVIGILLASLLIVIGLYIVIFSIGMNISMIGFDLMPKGILSISLGVIVLVYPSVLTFLMPIIMGIWIIASSSINLRISYVLKDIAINYWVLTLLTTILSIICGIILIINPLSSSIVITMFVGIMIIAYAVIDIIDMIIFKKNIRKLANNFKNIIISIKE